MAADPNALALPGLRHWNQPPYRGRSDAAPRAALPLSRLSAWAGLRRCGEQDGRGSAPGRTSNDTAQASI